MEEKFLTTEELAFRWNMSIITLMQWRWNGRGPRFHKMGRKVIYKMKDIEQFEDLRVCYNTAQERDLSLLPSFPPGLSPLKQELDKS